MAMELRGKASTKRLCFVVGVLLMLASTHFLSVEGGSEKLADGNMKMEDVKPIIGMEAYMDKVNSLSGSSRNAFRSLSFVLASGPSKKELEILQLEFDNKDKKKSEELREYVSLYGN
ncbi:unnamed protein product [Citrullus colocynthis]|uniref:Uncharacterized protein n=1 Tax=Citrullus colocynthis TaxID=252529 RepID=A0ABP0YBQ9_9ROSI